MPRKKKPEIVVDSQGLSRDLGDFDLDLHGEQAPLKKRLESLAADGRTPEQVSIGIQEKYARYLERVKKKKENEEKKAKTAKT